MESVRRIRRFWRVWGVGVKRNTMVLPLARVGAAPLLGRQHVV